MEQRCFAGERKLKIVRVCPAPFFPYCKAVHTMTETDCDFNALNNLINEIAVLSGKGTTTTTVRHGSFVSTYQTRQERRSEIYSHTVDKSIPQGPVKRGISLPKTPNQANVQHASKEQLMNNHHRTTEKDIIRRKVEPPKQVSSSKKNILEEDEDSDTSTDSLMDAIYNSSSTSMVVRKTPISSREKVSITSNKGYMRDMTTSSKTSFTGTINIVRQQQQQQQKISEFTPPPIVSVSSTTSQHVSHSSLSKRPGSVSTEIASMPYVAKQTLNKTTEMSITYAVEGYLSMYVPKKKKWKARWFELHDGDLVIRKKKSGRKSQVIPLYSVMFKHYAEDDTCFEINTAKSVVLVSAANVQERELWEDEIWKHKKAKREKRIKSLLFRVSKKNIDFEEYKDEQKKKYDADIDRQNAVKNRRKLPTPQLRSTSNSNNQESPVSTPPTSNSRFASILKRNQSMKKNAPESATVAAGVNDQDPNKKKVRFKEDNALRNMSHV